jgi:hypothetical protein
LAGFHSQIGVGRSENECQEDAEGNRLDGHLRRGFHGNLHYRMLPQAGKDSRAAAEDTR